MGAGADEHGSALRRELQRVVYEVHQDLADLNDVAQDPQGVGPSLERELDLLGDRGHEQPRELVVLQDLI